MIRWLTIWTVSILLLPIQGLGQQYFADRRIIAGEKSNVAVSINDPGEVKVLIRHSLGQTPIKPETGGNKIVFRLPPFLDERAGSYPVLLFRGNLPIGDFNLRIEPAASRERLEVYAGPKKIIVGGVESSMLVASSLDTYGNVRPDTITFHYSIHENSVQTLRPIHHLASFHSIYTGTISGNGDVSVTSGNLYHPGIGLFEAPGFPSELRLQYSRDHEYADPGSRVEINASPMTDRFGNIIVDGTLVEFIIRDKISENLSKAYGSTIEGIARVILPAPNHKTTWQINARILGEFMGSLEIPFRQSIREFDIDFDTETSSLSAGPFVNHNDQYIADGILMDMTFIKEGRFFRRSGRIMSGHYQVNTESLGIPPGEYRLEINQFGYSKVLEKILVR